MSVTAGDESGRPNDRMWRVEIRNEFAAVALEVDCSGNDPRLKVTDLETGSSIFLDASVLRSLVGIPDSLIDQINTASIQQEPAPAPPAGDEGSAGAIDETPGLSRREFQKRSGSVQTFARKGSSNDS